MKTNTLNHAIAEARRFIVAAQQTRPAMYDGKKYDWQEAGHHVAAVKRASMDLSRVLAELRAGK